MALETTYVTPQGVTALYHKILKIEISAIENAVTIVVALYPSAEVRDSGAQPLWHEYIRIPFEEMATDPRVPYYELVATHVGSYLNGAQEI